MEPDHQSPHPDNKDIICQLERILSSPDFNATPQQIALLNYVVNQTLAGRADNVKGYTIATEVFGRRSDFDQSIDPIVSIQAGRLRLALEQYYSTAGKNDPIRIKSPKGPMYPYLISHYRMIGTLMLNQSLRWMSWPIGRPCWSESW